MSIKLRYAKYLPDRLEGDKEGLVVHGHFEYDNDNNWVHVRVEHFHNMGVISLLMRKQSLPPLVTDDGWEKSILECTKFKKMIDLNATITKGSIKSITSLLIVETPHWEVSQVERTLRVLSWMCLGDPVGVTSCWHLQLAIDTWNEENYKGKLND